MTQKLVAGPAISTCRQAGHISDLDTTWRMVGSCPGRYWHYVGAIGVEDAETRIFWDWEREGRITVCQGPRAGGGYNLYARLNPHNLAEHGKRAA